MAGKSLILLSCSRAKRTGGGAHVPGSPSIGQFLADRGDALFHRRLKVKNALGRVHDPQDGYRGMRRPNRELVSGPDFGGSAQGGRYLPAYERYAGRLFQALQEKAPGFWNSQADGVEFAFLSGLYGLVTWNELVQDYDCNLNDVVAGERLYENHVEMTLALDESRAWFHQLPDETKKELSVAEYLARSAERDWNLPAAAVIVSFASAAEGFLRAALRSDATLGGLAGNPGARNMRPEILQLNELRGRAAHRGIDKPPGAGEINTARRLAWGVIGEIVRRA